MKIISLTSENIKRLHAVQIEPDGSLVIIGGRNEQGKTSVLDSIEYCLGGTDSVPTMPIRKGEDKAKIVADLGDLTVTRTFTSKGSRLVVANKDGSMHRTPQAILDSLTGRLSFDPLEFSRMKPDQQVATLKSLVGLDFSGFDREREKNYNDRTAINREIKALQVKIDAIPRQEAPEEEISVSNLVAELDRRQKVNQANEKERQSLKRMEDTLTAQADGLQKLKAKILELQNELNKAETQYRERYAFIEDLTKRIEATKDENTISIQSQIVEAEQTNTMVRSNKKRDELQGMLELKQMEATAFTQRIDDIETEKASQLGSAKFPIPELGFTENGVTYKGIPFDQCSSAEQLRVSVAMGLALNPKLKVLLIRDGSLLDEDNLALIAKMAGEAGGQVWLERVTQGKEASVIIEDGMVKKSATN